MATVLGVDGCPGGWVGALVDPDGTLRWHVDDLAGLLALDADAVAVDIPIGLPAGAVRRTADVQARGRLGPQRSSVFHAPPRAALPARDHATSSALSRAVGGAGLSVQTFHLLGKIREMDELLATDPRLHGRVVEAHPEVSFRALAGQGGPPLPGKLLADGRDVRLELLRGWLPSAALPRPRPGRARDDDCLDALVCAWTARRWLAGEAELLGGEPDAVGVPMRIAV